MRRMKFFDSTILSHAIDREEKKFPLMQDTTENQNQIVSSLSQSFTIFQN